MARPEKAGLDYFPLNVNFFEDEKIRYLGKEFGIKGEHIAVRILSQIYYNGYYIAWDKDAAASFWRTTYGSASGVTTELLKVVVGRLVACGFFHAGLYNQFGILTSAGIQRRYIAACARRKKILLRREFIVLDEDELRERNNIAYLSCDETEQGRVNACNNPVNVDINPVNVCINPQSKVNIASKHASYGVNACNNPVNACNNPVNAYINPGETGQGEAWNEAVQTYQDNIGRLPMGVVEDDLHFYFEQVGLDCFRLACEHTNRRNPDNKQNFILAILKSWAEQGICTRRAGETDIQAHLTRNRRRYGGEQETSDEIFFFGN